MASSALPAYQRIVTELREQISTGRLAPGTKLPSERDLAKQQRVSLMTARHALLELERAGLVTRRVGSGTYVTPSAGAVRRLRDPHAEFGAGTCQLQSAENGVERHWLADGVLVAKERIWMHQGEPPGKTPLLEHLDREDLFAVEEIEPAGDALRVRQSIYSSTQELLAVREMLVFGRKILHGISR